MTKEKTAYAQILLRLNHAESHRQGITLTPREVRLLNKYHDQEASELLALRYANGGL